VLRCTGEPGGLPPHDDVGTVGCTSRLSEVYPPPPCTPVIAYTLPCHKERALVRGGHLVHELGITQPAIRDDQRRGQCHAPSSHCCYASIEHVLHPPEFVTTRSARPLWIGSTDGKVHRDHQFALTTDYHEQDPINAGEYAVFLGTPPGAHQT
jgi:hypothetical protein